MITNKTFSFLKDLKTHNNRDWFTANKSRLEEAKGEFESFIAELIPHIATFDPPIIELEPKQCIFRIYRDTRFSKDKAPYKTNFGAHMVAGAKKPHGAAPVRVIAAASGSLIKSGTTGRAICSGVPISRGRHPGLRAGVHAPLLPHRPALVRKSPGHFSSRRC